MSEHKLDEFFWLSQKFVRAQLANFYEARRVRLMIVSVQLCSYPSPNYTTVN